MLTSMKMDVTRILRRAEHDRAHRHRPGPARFDAADRRSLGLLTMNERARELGGELLIDTAPGSGTRLTLKVPLL